jgi:hypothetical protein
MTANAPVSILTGPAREASARCFAAQRDAIGKPNGRRIINASAAYEFHRLAAESEDAAAAYEVRAALAADPSVARHCLAMAADHRAAAARRHARAADFAAAALDS